MAKFIKVVLAGLMSVALGAALVVAGMAFLGQGFGGLMFVGAGLIALAVIIVMGALITLIQRSLWGGIVFWVGLLMLTYRGQPHDLGEVAAVLWMFSVFVVWGGGIVAVMLGIFREVRARVQASPIRYRSARSKEVRIAQHEPRSEGYSLVLNGDNLADKLSMPESIDPSNPYAPY